MTDQLKESLSAFMDGELPESRQLLDRLKNDAELRAAWGRYHVIHDVLKQRFEPKAHSLAGRVSSALENEPALLAPKPIHSPSHNKRRLIGWSVAASVLFVSVLWLGQRTLTPDEDNQELVALNQDGQMTAEAEQTLSDYIANHNEYSVSTQMQGMLAYTRLVSYSPSQQQTANRVE